MRADEEACADSRERGAEARELRAGHLLDGLDFEVDEVTTGFSGFLQDFELCVEGACELASERLAAAGSDGRYVAAAIQQGF
jgi:hypothetical protein